MKINDLGEKIHLNSLWTHFFYPILIHTSHHLSETTLIYERKLSLSMNLMSKGKLDLALKGVKDLIDTFAVSPNKELSHIQL